ncbi:hypothetical protein PPERSA_00736 [Pseudocohnilembus persalinus]|uniref:Uncharacterized protein n=1 Tax=Pseudocohnilembus persalinus TaxID=266149 RepID=A0A0V0R4Q3_PSEPJ|nr:hypothetical protein PPERSA_00736 [Pseudocohnilembus persalinus]|eukprot:KRX09457.1 hypothetical protein PPERSA_00736 [Pseudocohnilembus persalinus]
MNSYQDDKNKSSSLPQKKKYNNTTKNAKISRDLFREKSNSMYSEKIQRQNSSQNKKSLNLIDSKLSEKEQEKNFPKSPLTDSDKNIQNEYSHQESIINDSSANILNQQEKIQGLNQNINNNNLSKLNELYNDINFIDSNNQSNNIHQQEPPLQVVRREKYVNTNQELNQHLQAQINTSDCSFSDEDFDNNDDDDDDDYRNKDNQCEENEIKNQQLNFQPHNKFQKLQNNSKKNSNEVCENTKNFTPSNSNIGKERKGTNTFRRNERHNFLFFKVINEVSHSKRQKNRQQKQAQKHDSSKGILVEKGDLHKNSLYAKKKGIKNMFA